MTNEYDAALKLYGGHELLSAAEEIALARRIKAGGADGQRARDEFIRCNMRMVLAEASKWKRGSGGEFDDLVQAGCIGLMRAIDKWDETRGLKFSTYATMWVFQSIQRSVTGGEVISLPGDIRKVRRYAKWNPDVTVDQLVKRLKVSERQVRAALAAAEVTASLNDQIVETDYGGTRLDVIEDFNADDPAELASLSADAAWLRDRLRELPADQREVLELMYGLNGYGGKEHSVPEVVRLTGHTTSTVKTLHNEGLRALREA